MNKSVVDANQRNAKKSTDLRTIAKLTSVKKVRVNRENANHGSGPKTVSGKARSSRNALKHGFFAQELVLSDAENLQVQALRRNIRAEHRPGTILQNVALDKVVCCIRWCELAMRLEMRKLSRLLDMSKEQETQEQETQPDKVDGPPGMANWYAASRQDLRAAIRALEFVWQDFNTNGRIREESKEWFVKTFGPDVWELLTKWMPMSYDAICLAVHLDQHRKTFPSPSDDHRPPDVVLDPDQGRQMVGKLLELQLHHLYGLKASWEQRTSQPSVAQAAGAVDFAPRYFTTASRDLHRAVEWFFHLKKKGL
jgi:hypothetical protein